jgi:hypothetical protein
LIAKETVVTRFLVQMMKGLAPAGLTALVLGGATLMTAAPALAQYRDDYGYRPRGDRGMIERRIDRPYGGPRYDDRRFYGRGCRVVVTRRINRFGEPVVVRRRICG